jgi:hypothetical protein
MRANARSFAKRVGHLDGINPKVYNAHAKRLCKQFERKHLCGKKSLIEMHASDDVRVAFEVFIIKAGAHATACVQSVHSIPDILANAVYYALGVNITSQALPERRVDIKTVCTALGKLRSTSRLLAALSESTRGNDWEYLAAVANTSKHRSVIRSSFSEDWTGERKNLRELQFAIFERGGKQFWSRSFEDSIGAEYDRLSKVVIETGHELNRWLSTADQPAT